MAKRSNAILSLKTPQALQQLDWRDFQDRDLTEEEFFHMLTVCDALWRHSGDLRDPHAEITTGRCSTSLVDTLRVLRFTNLCQLLAAQTARHIRALYDGSIDWVVGSSHAAATFSYAVATFLNAQHDFTEKGPNGTQIWNRFVIRPDEVVFQVEELVTSGQSFRAVRKGIEDGNPHPVTFAPLAFSLINRTEIKEIDGTPLHWTYVIPIEVFEPDECPLCRAGSKRMRPKQNWHVLKSLGLRPTKM